MIHGGTILKDVVQNAKLKQCSRLVQVVIKYANSRLVHEFGLGQAIIKCINNRHSGVQLLYNRWITRAHYATLHTYNT